MPTFLWKAKDADGREIVERIDAANALEAKETLAARGLTDLRLVKEESIDAASRGVAEASRPEYRVELTPEQESAYLEGRDPGFFGRWGSAIVKTLPWVLASAMLLWFVLPAERRFWLLISLLPILLFPAFEYWFGRTKRLYDELTRARTWSRWPDVLRLADQLESASSVVGIGVPEWELARHRGTALAGLGRLDEGVELFQEAAEDSDLDDWLTYAHLAEIFTVGGRPSEALALKQKSADEQPSNMNPLVDLAMHHVHFMGDTASAREVLGRIDPTIVVEFARPYLDLIEGMILCEEGLFDRAAGTIESALSQFAKHAHLLPFEGINLLAKSYLCLAYASSGRKDEARALWPVVEAYLTSAKENKRLLERIRAVI